MQLLTSKNVELLEAQGFEIAELTGFDDHSIPLYTHRPAGDKQPGDIVVRARVGNPDALDDGEATYLARKAFHGMFPWLPGEDCVKRSFFDVTVTGTGLSGGDSQTRRTETVKGCKWCRKNAEPKPDMPVRPSAAPRVPARTPRGAADEPA